MEYRALAGVFEGEPNPESHMFPPTPTCMRLATEHDADALRRLAALDSARPLTGPC